MSDRKDFRLVVDTYNFFYKNINKKESVVLKMFPTRIKNIENFIIKFREVTQTKIIQKDILEQFVEWNFNYWFDMKNSKYGNKGIQIEWIISNASMERWKAANPTKINYILGKNIRKKITYEKKAGLKENWDLQLLELNPLEEIEKERFFNTQKGFLNCSVFTTHYNHKSSNCLRCDFAESCKKLLKENLPKLYKKRGYENT